MTPVFLFSLPRAGSTFVQRVLATHPAVATSSEPWILLPLLYSLRERGIYTEYVQEWATVAIHDFCARLPGGLDDYRAALRECALQLYRRAAPPDARFFLDKTPRYHLIVEEVFQLFPEARFIFLWRNPLAVAASIIETWGKGAWNLHEYALDLYAGQASLVAAWEAHSAIACAVRYEDLVGTPDASWPRLFAHLGLDYDPAALRRFADVAVTARVGDQVGSRRYRELSTEPLDKWRRVLNNPLRRAWARRYLSWLGEPRLRAMGYDLAALRAELDAAPASARGLAGDLGQIALGSAYGLFELRMMKDKMVDARPASLVTPHH